MASVAGLPGGNHPLILMRNNGKDARGRCPKARVVSGRRGQLAVVVAVGCRQWSCTVCGERLARHYAVMAHAGCALVTERLRLLTVTCPRESPEVSWGALSDRWRRLNKRLARHIGRGLTYFLVVERQRRGSPHVHVLTRDTGYLHRPIVQGMAHAVGFGYCDIRQVATGDGARRVSRYLVKGSGVAFPRHVHRVSRSRNWCQTPPKWRFADRWGEGWTWETWDGCDTEWVEERLRREGLRMLRTNDQGPDGGE